MKCILVLFHKNLEVCISEDQENCSCNVGKVKGSQDDNCEQVTVLGLRFSNPLPSISGV